MEEEKEGISLGDIFRVIFSQKWLALVIALAITFLGTIALYLGYNSVKTYYVSTFSINFPGSDAASPVYPDNTPFNYRDLVSRKNLNEVKAGNEEFADIDVDELYSQNRISITREDTALTEGSLDIAYTVRVYAKAFKNAKQAEEFIDAIAQIPLTYVKGLADGYDVYISDDSYGGEKFYEGKCELLTKQADYISAEIASLSSKTGGELKNKTIALSVSLDRFTGELEALIGEMRENRYVKNVDEAKKIYKERLVTMENELTNKQRELDLIYGKYGDVASDLPNIDRVSVLAEEIAGIEDRRGIYMSYLSDSDGGDTYEGTRLATNEEFDARLAGLYGEIKGITEKYQTYLGNYYDSSTMVAYENSLSSDGKLGIAVCIAISLVIGLTVAAVAAFAVGWRRLKVQPAAGETSKEEEPAAENPQTDQEPESDGKKE